MGKSSFNIAGVFMRLKEFAKEYLPTPILQPLKKAYAYYSKESRRERKLIRLAPKLHAKAVKRIREKKGPINVVFFAIFDSVWKYDELYQLMVEDKRFNPTILVCPFVSYGKESMLETMEKCYNLFKSRSYNVLRAYNSAKNNYIDVRKELEPDIIFYTNPYEGLIDNGYFIKKFTDILTCYTPYSIQESKNPHYHYNLLLHNLLWRYYLGFHSAIGEAKQQARNKGKNTVYTGYPGIDRFIKTGEQFEDVWKIKDRKIKRIIWAPHHTITDYAFISYSTFLDYCDYMLDIAHRYKDKIQIAFKPHPLLRNRLNEMWGCDRTNAYYSKWEELPNGMLEDGAYEDLFMTSDAIIHDSGSFIGEYLYTNHPAMFLSNGRPFFEQYNELGIRCLDNYYIGKNKEDIESFILNLIEGNDPLKEQRERFVTEELLPPNGKLASENIIDDLLKELRQ